VPERFRRKRACAGAPALRSIVVPDIIPNPIPLSKPGRGCYASHAILKTSDPHAHQENVGDRWQCPRASRAHRTPHLPYPRLRVMLDSDLAELYQVTTGNLNLAVRRSSGHFPEDFMFQFAQEEFDNLRLQFATSSFGYGGRRTCPMPSPSSALPCSHRCSTASVPCR
jgi:hypothetical protein